MGSTTYRVSGIFQGSFRGKGILEVQQVLVIWETCSTECDIRIDFNMNIYIWIYSYQEDDMNEYPNVFVWNKTIQILYEWIFVSKMTRIFKYSNICHTLPEYDFDTNEYLNIFASRKRIYSYRTSSQKLGRCASRVCSDWKSFG